MQINGSGQCGLGRPALCQQGGDEAGQHIAAAGGGESRIAAGIDLPAAVGRGDDRAAALERHPGAETPGNRAGAGDAVCLDGLRSAVQQTCCLSRMRRQQRRRLARRQCSGQRTRRGFSRGIFHRDQIERVGIEDERNRLRAGLCAGGEQQRVRGGRDTQTRAAGKDGKIGRQQGFRRAQHQFHLRRVEGGSVGIQQADINTAAAQA